MINDIFSSLMCPSHSQVCIRIIWWQLFRNNLHYKFYRNNNANFGFFKKATMRAFTRERVWLLCQKAFTAAQETVNNRCIRGNDTWKK